VSEVERLELGILVGEIWHLNTSIAKVEALLCAQGPHLPGWTNLTSITGIWVVGASILLSTIGNIADFPSEGKLAAYFGIFPRAHNSNATELSGHITKRGAKLGRTALVRCALIAARYSPYLEAFYRWLAAKCSTGKAIIALARKFLRVIYRTLKHNWVFEDFPRFVLANG
jgi:transposase